MPYKSSRPIDNLPTTYTEAKERLGNRESRKVANNTQLIAFGGERKPIVLRLHSTNVVTFWSDGTITLNTGGWQTVTTAQRLNVVTKAHGYHVGSNGARKPENRFWEVRDFATNAESVRYVDGFTFTARPVEWNGERWSVRDVTTYATVEPLVIDVSDTVAFVLAFETEPDSLTEEQVISGFQGLIDSGAAWSLQGSYGRAAQALIENGYCHA